MGRLIVRYLVGTVLIGVLIVAGVTARVASAPSGIPDRAQSIVVLGAAQYDGRPSPVFAARLDRAHELFAAGVAAEIVTVGYKQEGDRFTEAEAGADYLIDHGVPEAVITEVSAGGDTLESLRAATVVLKEQGVTSVVLVTDPAHAHRSAVMARDLGLQVQTAVVTTGPATQSGVSGRYVLREVAGTLFHLVVGGSSGLGQEVW